MGRNMENSRRWKKAYAAKKSPEQRAKDAVRSRNYYAKNKEKLLAQQKLRYEGNKEEILASQLAWYHRTKHKRGIKDRVRRTPEERRRKQQEGENRRYRERALAAGYVVKMRRSTGTVSKEQLHEEMLEASRRYRMRHPERRRESTNLWARNNRAAQIKKWGQRYRTDPVFNLAIKIRRRIGMAIRNARKGARKQDHVIDLLGCSYRDLKVHIENQFSEGMSWDKCFTGEIHLDHKKPCASFDLTDPAQQRECFHFTNLQPLWGVDNLRKGARIQ